MNIDLALSPPAPRAGTFIRAAGVLVLAGITAALCLTTPNINLPSEAGVEMKLPDRVGEFHGKDQDVSESEKVILPKDTEFAKKSYEDYSGDQLFCQIVLSGGEKRSIHRPEICLPGQGWNIKSGEVIPIKLNNGDTLKVTKLIIARPTETQPGVRREFRMVFLYWFVGKNMTTPYHWMRLFHANWDRVVNNTNHRWAYVIASAPILEGFTPTGKNEEQTLQMLKGFVGEAAMDIVKFEKK